MPYTPEQVAAFIGAAAWAPHIATWAYKAFQKPKVVIIPDCFVEIGFTNLGPIFNVRLAVSSDTQDVLLDSFTAEVAHENGESRLFHWRGTRETLSQVRDGTGIRQTVEKDDSGIAIKVQSDTLLDKFFRFQDLKFQSTTKPSFDELVAHLEYLRSIGSEARNLLFKSDRFRTFLNFYSSAFTWRPGLYKVRFRCEAIHAKIIQVPEEFSFELAPLDIEALKDNLSRFEPYLEWHLFGQTESLPNEPTFQWRYPTLARMTAVHKEKNAQ